MSRTAPTLILALTLGGLLLFVSQTVAQDQKKQVPSGPSLGVVGERGATLFIADDLPAPLVGQFLRLPADDNAWKQTFGVYVRKLPLNDVDTKAQPAMAGTYSFLIKGNRLTFKPQFPLVPGVQYQSILTLPDGKRMTLDYTIPKPAPGLAARVTEIWPTAEVLPENQLRFYLHFSAPMSRGEAYEHLTIVDENNKAAELSILELGEELWDPSGQRLTILIDPGRIKRGVKPREVLGTVFKAGGKYSLVVSKDWQDAQGQSLADGHRKTFRVADPIEAAIQPADWKLETPAAGTRDPLIVRFPRPLDRALLERMLSVAPVGEKPANALAGKVKVSAGEQRWEFLPDEPWPSAHLELVVDPALEDLAGNRIGRPFEVVGAEKGATGGLTEPHRIPLSLK